MTVDLSTFQKYGRGVLALFDHQDRQGWHFVPVEHIIDIHDHVVLKRDWSVPTRNAVFIWNNMNEVTIPLYGRVCMRVDSPWIFSTYPSYETFFYDELIQQKMLAGNMHCYVEPTFVFPEATLSTGPFGDTIAYGRATTELWSQLSHAFFDNENDAIVAVALLDEELSTHDFLALSLKYKDTDYSYADCKTRDRGDLWLRMKEMAARGVTPGQLNIIGSGRASGKSMMGLYHWARLARNSQYGKTADLIIFDDVYMPPKKIRTPKAPQLPSKPQHRITSVQQRDRSTQRSHRK